MDLEYHVAYHLRCQVALRCGRRVTLQSLDQWMTYDGWLEGVPSREWNDGIVAGSLREAERRGAGGARPFLIAPARRGDLREPGDMAGTRAMSDQAPEWLPMVTCVGVLRDLTPIRGASKAGSMLTVLWFQDEYALPIDVSVLRQLQSLDWERLAADIDD